MNHSFSLEPPRLIAFLGGTTNWGDCLTAMQYLLNPRQMIQGNAIQAYEQEFARKFGVRFAFSFASGRVGLHGILLSMGIQSGDEVLLQAPTHIVVPNAIRYTGARPVYVDCRLDDYTIDLEHAARRVTAKTKVLVLQHTFGIPSNMDAIRDFVADYGLTLVEDCVHALGSRYAGRLLGTFGRAGFFSTEETKTISSTMGGMVITDDDELATKLAHYQQQCCWPSTSLTRRYLLKLIAYHVQSHPYLHTYSRKAWELIGRRNPLPRPTVKDELIGRKPANYSQRLSNAQAALCLRQIQRLDEIVAHRRNAVNRYDRLLAGSAVRRPSLSAGAEPCYLRYPIWVEEKEATHAVASPHALLGTWFSSVLMEAMALEYGEYTPGTCPNAETAIHHLLNLPVHLNVKERDIDRIVASILTVNSNRV